MSAVHELLTIRQQLVDAVEKVCTLISAYEAPPHNVKIYDVSIDAERIATQDDVDALVRTSDAFRKTHRGEWAGR